MSMSKPYISASQKCNSSKCRLTNVQMNFKRKSRGTKSYLPWIPNYKCGWACHHPSTKVIFRIGIMMKSQVSKINYDICKRWLQVASSNNTWEEHHHYLVWIRHLALSRVQGTEAMVLCPSFKLWVPCRPRSWNAYLRVSILDYFD